MHKRLKKFAIVTGVTLVMVSLFGYLSLAFESTPAGAGLGAIVFWVPARVADNLLTHHIIRNTQGIYFRTMLGCTFLFWWLVTYLLAAIYEFRSRRGKYR